MSVVKNLEHALEQARTLENHSAADKASFCTMARNLRIMSRNLHTMRTELAELQGTLDRERASHDIVWADRCAARQEVEELTQENVNLKTRIAELEASNEVEELTQENVNLKTRIAELEASNEVLTQSCQANAYSAEYVQALEYAAWAYVPEGSRLDHRIASERQKMQETRKNLGHK